MNKQDQISKLEKEIKDLTESVERYSAMEQAVKIVLNGGYGALGNTYFRYFDLTIAEATTATGQIAIKFITKKLNEFIASEIGKYGGSHDVIDRIISSDTDSVYMGIDELVKLRWGDIEDHQLIADKVNEYALSTIEPFIEKSYQELTDYMNVNENLLDMKREAIADKFIIRAKKNYAMRVIDNEGIRYAHPKPKLMGFEAVKTTHAMMVRESLAKCIDILFDGTVDDIRNHVSKFKEEYMTCKIEKIASPKRVNGIEKYSTKDHKAKKVKGMAIPMHVLGAIMYNSLVHKLNLSNRYPFIRSGDNIKYFLLKEPNPIDCHVIAFIDEFPPEFELDQFIDKELQFDKYFVKPLESFMVYNGWTLEESLLNDLLGNSTGIAKVASIKNVKKEKKKPIVVNSIF